MRAKDEQKVAKRYARALFELCEPPQLDAVATALTECAGLYRENDELRVALQNPAVSRALRMEIVGDIGKQMLPDFETFSRFLSLVADNGRTAMIPQISSFFNVLVAEMKKVLALEIASAFPLSESERQEILKTIQREHGAGATVSWRVDPEVLGGLVIRAGETMIDGSIRGGLEKAREALVGYAR